MLTSIRRYARAVVYALSNAIVMVAMFVVLNVMGDIAFDWQPMRHLFYIGLGVFIASIPFYVERFERDAEDDEAEKGFWLTSGCWISHDSVQRGAVTITRDQKQSAYHGPSHQLWFDGHARQHGGASGGRAAPPRSSAYEPKADRSARPTAIRCAAGKSAARRTAPKPSGAHVDLPHHAATRATAPHDQIGQGRRHQGRPDSPMRSQMAKPHTHPRRRGNFESLPASPRHQQRAPAENQRRGSPPEEAPIGERHNARGRMVMAAIRCKFCSWTTSTAFAGGEDKAFERLNAHIDVEHPAKADELAELSEAFARKYPDGDAS
jgi:hypothetical protein